MLSFYVQLLAENDDCLAVEIHVETEIFQQYLNANILYPQVGTGITVGVHKAFIDSSLSFVKFSQAELT